MMKKTNQPMRIAVAMSGGVDSSVTAALLKEQGHDVIGITMRVWDPSTSGVSEEAAEASCCSPDDVRDAGRIADQLDIPFYVVNFEDEFRRLVISDFIGEYYQGRTPNPCVRCNELVKFGLLLEKARELGADFLATGHYAQVEKGDDGFFHLLKGLDPKKDQSYFLFALSQEQLARSLFPLGGITKQEVRALAARFELRVAEKGESQEICFIPDDNYVRFLDAEQDAQNLSGAIVDQQGNILGHHQGTYRYTVGQRRGLGIAWKEPLYVLGVDAKRREVIVGPQDALYKNGLRASHINWMMPTPAGEFSTTCRIRYRHQAVPCRVIPVPDNRVEVLFTEKEKSVTPGQAVVFYDENRVLGGGWIDEGL
ncbi:MAG: tRNA 2-thiouridine(34) synthase MnmA [Deltaproteobacteria bacterium]|nr:tRNA 2-thiouridine(34) synthase MnmA [Deltaproteobacteria bacterium]TLN02422.1 MAG: tRNA 2-thiouridine(34) synthase MnmA [bacterium]